MWWLGGSGEMQSIWVVAGEAGMPRAALWRNMPERMAIGYGTRKSMGTVTLPRIVWRLTGKTTSWSRDNFLRVTILARRHWRQPIPAMGFCMMDLWPSTPVRG